MWPHNPTQTHTATPSVNKSHTHTPSPSQPGTQTFLRDTHTPFSSRHSCGHTPWVPTSPTTLPIAAHGPQHPKSQPQPPHNVTQASTPRWLALPPAHPGHPADSVGVPTYPRATPFSSCPGNLGSSLQEVGEVFLVTIDLPPNFSPPQAHPIGFIREN